MDPTSNLTITTLTWDDLIEPRPPIIIEDDVESYIRHLYEEKIQYTKPDTEDLFSASLFGDDIITNNGNNNENIEHIAAPVRIELSSEDKKRREFTMGTKELLRRKARDRCCICGKNTGIDNISQEGSASHIYAQDPNALFRCDPIRHEFVGSEENGIWTCGTHTKILDHSIDGKEYTVERLVKLRNKHYRSVEERLDYSISWKTSREVEFSIVQDSIKSIRLESRLSENKLLNNTLLQTIRRSYDMVSDFKILVAREIIECIHTKYIGGCSIPNAISTYELLIDLCYDHMHSDSLPIDEFEETFFEVFYGIMAIGYEIAKCSPESIHYGIKIMCITLVLLERHSKYLSESMYDRCYEEFNSLSEPQKQWSYNIRAYTWMLRHNARILGKNKGKHGAYEVYKFERKIIEKFRDIEFPQM